MKKLSKPLLVLGFAMIMIGNTGLALAEKEGYYRWHDDEGNAHYTQLPPVGRASEFVATKTGKISTTNGDSDTAAEANADQSPPETKPADNKLPDKMEVLPQKDPERCRQAQDMIRATDNKAKRFRSIDEKGETKILSPEEIEEQRKRAREMIDLHC